MHFLVLIKGGIRVEVTLYEPRSLRIDKEVVDGREESSGGKDWGSGGATLKIVI